MMPNNKKNFAHKQHNMIEHNKTVMIVQLENLIVWKIAPFKCFVEV